MESSDATIQIFCAPAPSYGVTTTTQDSWNQYLAEGYTLYKGPVDRNGEPTDADWCRLAAGQAPAGVGHSSGQSGGGFVANPEGSDMTMLPVTGASNTGEVVGLLVGVVLLAIVVRIVIKKLLRRHRQRKHLQYYMGNTR